MAVSTDIPAYMGDTTTIRATLMEDDEVADITGLTLVWLISPTSEGRARVKVTVTEHEDAVNGISTATFTPSDLVAAGGPGRWYLTVVSVDSLGRELTRMMSRLQVYDRPSII